MFNFLKLVLVLVSVLVVVLEIFCFVYRERNIVHLSTISDEWDVNEFR